MKNKASSTYRHVEGDFIKIRHWLIPLSTLFGIGVKIRNLCFDMGILKSRSFKIPVISVGNITVGGAGKTPHVEYLIRLLQNNSKVAVVSRGYKRKSKGYILANKNTNATEIGDEPAQMYFKYGLFGNAKEPVLGDKKGVSDSNNVTTSESTRPIHVAVCASRCEAIERITSDEETRDTDVILLDDAYQHRYVKPGINILLIDYHRLIIYDKLLPAGMLREPQEGKSRADIVIVTKCPKELRPMEFRVLTKALDLYPYQKLFFTTLNYGDLYPIFNENAKKIKLSDIKENHSILLLTGIASPEQLTVDLHHLTEQITPMIFNDHHRFTDKDAYSINDTFARLQEPRMIVTTEKDAARLKELDSLSDDVRNAIYALPVEIQFMLEGKELFDEKILSFVLKNSKDSILNKQTKSIKPNTKTHLSQTKENKESGKVNVIKF